MVDKLDKAKAEQQLEQAKNRAEKLLNDPEKANKVISDAIKKASSAKGPLEKVWGDLQLMFGIVKDWFSGEYKEIPTGSIVAILGGLIYFVSPIDLIPDFIPIIGYIDDVFILGLIIAQISADLQKYQLWKESKIA